MAEPEAEPEAKKRKTGCIFATIDAIKQMDQAQKAITQAMSHWQNQAVVDASHQQAPHHLQIPPEERSCCSTAASKGDGLSQSQPLPRSNSDAPKEQSAWS